MDWEVLYDVSLDLPVLLSQLWVYHSCVACVDRREVRDVVSTRDCHMFCSTQTGFNNARRDGERATLQCNKSEVSDACQQGDVGGWTFCLGLQSDVLQRESEGLVERAQTVNAKNFGQGYILTPPIKTVEVFRCNSLFDLAAEDVDVRRE